MEVVVPIIIGCVAAWGTILLLMARASRRKRRRAWRAYYEDPRPRRRA